MTELKLIMLGTSFQTRFETIDAPLTSVERVCRLIDTELARDSRPIVLVGAGPGGPLAYRAAARSRRPIGLVATTLAVRRRCWPWRAARPAIEPQHFTVCPVLLAPAAGAPDLARSRRFFDRLAARKRLIMLADGSELAAAAAPFLRELQRAGHIAIR